MDIRQFQKYMYILVNVRKSNLKWGNNFALDEFVHRWRFWSLRSLARKNIVTEKPQREQPREWKLQEEFKIINPVQVPSSNAPEYSQMNFDKSWMVSLPFIIAQEGRDFW